MMCAALPELKPLHELPSSWSVPVPGVPCKMTELPPYDPEFIEVERNARKTSGQLLKQIISVSETCELLFNVFVLVNAHSSYK